MFEILYNRWRRYLTPHGGRGSGKSRTTGLILVIIAMLCKRYIVLARNYEAETEKSIWKNIVDRIKNDLELTELFKITENRITCLATGTVFEKAGLLEDPEKIKSLEGCDILVYEEADKATERVWDKVLPTIRDDQDKRVSIISIFNPDWRKSPTYKTLITQQDELVNEGGHFTRLINYLDNPFCPESISSAAEKMKRLDYDKYLTEYLGVPRDTSELQVFHKCFEIVDFYEDTENRFPTHPNAPGYLGEIEYMFGVAMGYSQKPAFALRCFMFDGSLYIDKEYSGVDVDINKLARVVFKMPGNDDGITYSDPRTPSSTDQFSDRLSELGGSSIVADKWSGDVIDAIIYLRNMVRQIYIHPSCVKTIDSISNYLWEYDPKKEEIQDKPQESSDQAFHAIRFAVNDYIQGHRYL
ncbi:TPA: phage terminase large subunit [Vibrio harveyi]|nr:phage terminase large subunit [Vibrio harveyi]